MGKDIRAILKTLEAGASYFLEPIYDLVVMPEAVYTTTVSFFAARVMPV